MQEGITLNAENIVNSTNYFNLSEDELLEIRNDYDYTREECMLFDDGWNDTFFDDADEMLKEAGDFLSWLNSQRYVVKSLVRTINGRIAVVSV